jgi:queuine tRNA-ribosyltransferase
VTFANHVDGSELLLTPRSAIDAQRRLGADLIMALDECVPADAGREQAAEAVRRTTVWARQCKDEWLKSSLPLGGGQGRGARAEGEELGPSSHPTSQADEDADSPLPALPPVGEGELQMLFGIVQGNLFLDLRRQSAEQLGELDFPGYAIGGLSVGEGHERMMEILAPTAAMLPADRPRYLMGVGEPRDILAAVASGVDMFDCVLPTRNGRNGLAFTADGPVRLRNERFKLDDQPIEPDCDALCCRRYSRGVIRHLMLADEMLGPILVSLHNVRFFQRLMSAIRTTLADGTYDSFRRQWLARYESN